MKGRNCSCDVMGISQKCYPWPKSCVISSVQLLGGKKKKTTQTKQTKNGVLFTLWIPLLHFPSLSCNVFLLFIFSHSSILCLFSFSWFCNCIGHCWVQSGTMSCEIKGTRHAGVLYSHLHSHRTWLTHFCYSSVSSDCRVLTAMLTMVSYE